MKKCYHCSQTKPCSEYYGDKYTKDGYKSCCKECTKSRAKRWRDQNPEKARAGINRWRAENQDYWNTYCRFHRGSVDTFEYKGQRKGKSREEARKHIREWKSLYDEVNREAHAAYHKWKASQPGFREKVNERTRKWLEENPSAKVSMAVRGRLNGVLRARDIPKHADTVSLLGCDWNQFRKWIESNFLPGMSWENRGSGNGCWHIDHYIPCASFDLTDKAQLEKCFHWSNQFPCWAEDNICKGARMPPPLPEEKQARIIAFQAELETERAA